MIEVSTLISIVISVLSVSVAAIVGITNMRRNKTADDRKEATEMTTVIVKLENISTDTKEIKNELRSVKGDIQGLRERIAIVEQSSKSLHKRVDGFETRINKTDDDLKKVNKED